MGGVPPFNVSSNGGLELRRVTPPPVAVPLHGGGTPLADLFKGNIKNKSKNPGGLAFGNSRFNTVHGKQKSPQGGFLALTRNPGGL